MKLCFRIQARTKIIIVPSDERRGSPPPLRLRLHPQTPPACSRQEWTGLSMRQRSARRRTRSHAELTNLGLTPQDCTVGTALTFCNYATIEGCKHAAASAQAHNVHKHVHTNTHTCTHTCTGTHTHTGAHTHRHTCTCARAHTHTHTHTHSLSLSGTQAVQKLAHACSSRSSSDSNNSKSHSFERGWLLNVTVK